ncbi:DUF4351 domain-containing protein [filamentous cyanobacterium LEGE 11480]|uniref:DUF4351 domain-containing protein n=1 Tax=Romeriopsis navalis LEGE 11480 TaxID=2777977 RepID=A0A928VPY8_9CYAN|nr:DUF4351 domain-containing protein [Romeriopsis navalis]MBE9030761.1 DUF4351 domain-containing protein [Romeriopsis navalis LEGE 11480]
MEAILRFFRQLPFFQKFQLQNVQSNVQSTLMIQQLSRIIGPIAPVQQQRIKQLSPSQMDALAQAADNLSTPDDLADWLSSQGV